MEKCHLAVGLVNGVWTGAAFRLFFLNADAFVRHGLTRGSGSTEVIAYATRFLGGANGALSLYALGKWFRAVHRVVVQKKAARRSSEREERVWDHCLFALMHFSQFYPNIALAMQGSPAAVRFGSLMKLIMLGDFVFCVANVAALCVELRDNRQPSRSNRD